MEFLCWHINSGTIKTGQIIFICDGYSVRGINQHVFLIQLDSPYVSPGVFHQDGGYSKLQETLKIADTIKEYYLDNNIDGLTPDI